MLRLVIADDDLISLEFLSELISGMGYEVIAKAPTGPEAYQICAEKRPDIALLDISMPGEYNGLEAGQKIMTDLGIPCVFITAYSTGDVIERIREIGAYGYLVKPYTENQIHTAIDIASYRFNQESRLKHTLGLYRVELERRILLQSLLELINAELNPADRLREFLAPVLKGFSLLGAAIADITLHGELAMVQGLEWYPGTQNEPAIKGSADLPAEWFSEHGLFLIPSHHRVCGELLRAKLMDDPSGMLVLIDESKTGTKRVVIFMKNQAQPFGRKQRTILKALAQAIMLAKQRHDNFVLLRQMEEEKRQRELIIQRTARLASLGELSAAIAHEIRQPLQSIRVLTESALYWQEKKGGASVEGLLETMKTIDQRVERIDQIIRSVNRMVQPPVKQTADSVDLNTLVSQAMEFHQEKLARHSIEFRHVFYDQLPKIAIAPAQLEQVVNNLVNNAVDSLDQSDSENKWIEVSTGLEKDAVYLKIQDNGGGVPEELRNKIFDPFFSTKLGKETSGMGLGLYMVYTILQCFNAQIEYRQPPEGGASFWILFYPEK